MYIIELFQVIKALPAEETILRLPHWVGGGHSVLVSVHGPAPLGIHWWQDREQAERKRRSIPHEDVKATAPALPETITHGL